MAKLHAVIFQKMALLQQAHACTKFHFSAYSTPRRGMKSGKAKHISQRMQVATNSNSFATAKSGTAKIEVGDESAAGGFFRGSVIPTSTLSTDKIIEDFVVVVVGVLDVSETEIVLSPPGEHLAFSGIIFSSNIIVSSLQAVRFVLTSGAHQRSKPSCPPFLVD